MGHESTLAHILILGFALICGGIGWWARGKIIDAIGDNKTNRSSQDNHFVEKEG